MRFVAPPGMARRTLVVALLVAAALQACTSHHTNPVVPLHAPRIHGPLSTDGLRIVDAATNKGTKCAGVGMPDWLYQGVTDEIAARRSFFADQGNQQELYADAWKFVAERYASDPLVVAADMMNEPYTKHELTLSELNLDQLYQTLGRAIRSVNPNILLTFQDSQYSGPDSTFALSAPPSFPGVVYSFHYYVDNW